MTPWVAIVVLATVLAAARPATAQSLKVDELIPKATAYAHHFVERFTNVVAEERYEQETTSPKRKRVLVSDFLLVKPPGDDLWNAFRDVVEVDGQLVRDREDRLTKLFLEPTSNVLQRAAEIRAAGARHNLADIGTLDNPLYVISFLQSQYVDRFWFSLEGLDRRLGPNVRKVRFVEFRRPSLLRARDSVDLLSDGSIWVDEGTGRVVKTELLLGGQTTLVRIATLFMFDEELGINVPAVMEDRFPNRVGQFRGKATYGKFRRFQVNTQETIRPGGG